MSTTIDIKNIFGAVIVSSIITEDAISHEELMNSDYVQLSWNSDTGDTLPAGAYIMYGTEKYSLLEPYTPTRADEAEYQYTPQFQSRIMGWQKHPVPIYTYADDGTTVEAREFDWEFTGSPADAMYMVQQAIKNETGETWAVQLADSLPATISISSQSSSIFSVLNDIANQCKTEWWGDKTTNTLYLSQCKHGTAIPLSVGVNVKVPSVTPSKDGYFTRFYVFGSSRNVTQDISQGAATNSIINRRLTLDPASYPGGYIDAKPNMQQGEIFTTTLYYDNIYPSSKLAISDVRSRLKYRLDSNGNKIQTGADDEGNPVYEQYAIWYFRIADFSFDPETIIEGMNLSVSFETGQLASRDFELAYHEKAETVNDNSSDVVPFNIKAGDYEIILDESTGTIIPGLAYIIPQDGDQVILYNIEMPAEYTASARQELAETAQKDIAKRIADNNSYEFDSNPVDFYENSTDLTLGQAVTFSNGEMSLSTRVLMVEKHLDSPCRQRIRVGNEIIKGNTQQLREEVTQASQNIDVLAAFNELSTSLQNTYGKYQREMTAWLAAMQNMWQFDPDEPNTIYSKYNVYNEGWLSTKGKNPDAGGEVSGATSLQELSDVALSSLQSGQALVWNGSKWTNQTIDTGLDTAALAQYLTANNYAKKSDIPSLSGYATEQWVTTKLGSYYTSQQVDAKLGQKVDTAFFAKLIAAIAGDGTEIAVNDIETAIASIQVKFGLWSGSWISAKGQNPDAGGTVSGATDLDGLSDVTLTNLQNGQVLMYNGSQWVNSTLDVGLDETALAQYLTSHLYATQSWVTSQNYATEDDLDARIDALVNGAPAAFDTLKEIADVLQGNVDSIGDILTALGNKADKTITIIAGTGLTGGGNLSANRTLSLAKVGTAGTYTKVTVDAYGRVTAGKSLAAGDIPDLEISKITGLQSALNAKLDASTFNELFEKVTLEDGTTAIRAKYGLYSDNWLSTMGANPDAGGTVPGGASSLGELSDVSLGELSANQVLAWDSDSQKWVNKTIEAGLDTAELEEYLTENNYAKKSDISIAGLTDLHSSWDALLKAAPSAYVTRWPTAAEVGALTQATGDGRYVTINTDQTITGKKTFAQGISFKYDTDDSRVYSIFFNNTSNSGMSSIGYHNTAKNFYLNPIGSSDPWNDAVGKYSLFVGNNKLTYNTYPILTSNNYTSYIGNSFVKKAGDTMTGTLTINTPNFNEQLTIYRNNSAGSSVIGYSNSSGLLGVIGVCGRGGTYPGQPYFGKGDGSGDYKIWTSGNDGSGSGLDADFIGGIYTTKNISKNDNGGRPTYILVSDVTTWFNSTTYDAMHGFRGMICGFRSANRNGDGVCIMQATAAYAKGYQRLYVDRAIGVYPRIVSYNSRYYIALYCTGSGFNMYLFGQFYNWINSPTQLLCTTSTGTYSGLTVIYDYAGYGILGNATTATTATQATQLQTARTLWGQSFNGTANVSGNMKGVGDISMSGSLINHTGAVELYGATPYIDFHYNNSSADYTSRLIANGSSNLNCTSNFTANGNITAPSFYASGWFRSTGQTGWYSQTYGGGIYMTDSTYVRVYNGKRFYASGGQASPYSGSTWIGMATRTNCIYGDQWNSLSSAHCLYRVRSYNGNALCFGGLGDQLGFYAFTAANISSGANVMWAMTYWDMTNWTLTHGGVLHCTGGIYSDSYVSAKGNNSSSDIRLKNILSPIRPSLEAFAKAPLFRFAWKSNPGMVEIGSSAQYWRNVLPDTVKERDGWLEMGYGNIALAGVITIARDFETLEQRVDRLEKENDKLKKKVKELERRAA